jgi:microsomal epoxide hydrolase
MSNFSKLPSAATINPTPFKVSIPQEQLDELQTLLKLSKIAPPTYENTRPTRQYGITSDWLTTIRKQWQNDFDWYTFSISSL